MTWLGRSLDAEGFVKVYPDTYGTRMLEELLRYALTVDALEREAAAEAGLDGPRFVLVPPASLVAIDALWSVHGLAQRPFAALAIWRDVHMRGQRFMPPAGPAFEPRPFPAPRYLYVGANWEDGASRSHSGMRDAIRELVAFDDETSGHRRLTDGRIVLDMGTSELFAVDETGAALFLQWEAERMLEDWHDGPRFASTRAFFTYVELGLVTTAPRHQGTLDALMRRASWKRRHGFDGAVRLERLLAASVPAEQRALELERHAKTVRPAPTLREQLCEPLYL